MPPHRSSNTNDAPTHTHTQLCSSRDASCTRLAVGGRGPAAGPVIMVLVHPSRVVAPCRAEAPSHACTVWTRALRSSRGVPLSIAATRWSRRASPGVGRLPANRGRRLTGERHQAPPKPHSLCPRPRPHPLPSSPHPDLSAWVPLMWVTVPCPETSAACARWWW